MWKDFHKVGFSFEVLAAWAEDGGGDKIPDNTKRPLI